MKKSKKEVRSDPLVSFCVATYKRPDFLKSTLTSLLNQTYKNFEIVVSDNDPEGSSEKIVKSFKSKKIIYHKNNENVGMVKNFNNAFKYTKGDYITYISDDDPLMIDMLDTLINLKKAYPDCVGYFGAGYVYVDSQKVAEANHLRLGLTSLKNKLQKDNETHIYSPESFLKGYFSTKILPDFIWSTGIISRNALKKIGGITSYGSAHFTDYALLINLANQGKLAIINKELGISKLHDGSYFKSDRALSEYVQGVLGFHHIAYPIAEKFNCIKSYEKFIAQTVFFFLLHNNNLNRKGLNNTTNNDLYSVYKKLIIQLPFLNKREFEIFLRLHYPVPFNFLFNGYLFTIQKIQSLL